jgi:hypothetical protein
MKTIPSAAAVLAVTTLFAVCSCAAQPRGAVLCGEKPSSGPVVVEVGLANGVPSANPKVCVVQPGARVDWVSDKAFVLSFKRMSPGGANSPKDPSSQPAPDGKQKIGINAAAPEGSYDYGITIDGKSVDPAIIIKKAQ